jgi:hypothetical protein
MRQPWIVAFALAGWLAVSPAAAFTFSDGTTLPCVASGQVVVEMTATDGAMAARVGWAQRDDDRWVILWNPQRLKALPPEMHDFIFFHECAHAQLATDIELEANCAGLVAMRAAGRAGPDVEAKLRARYPDSEYWKRTFSCADAAAKPAARKD